MNRHQTTKTVSHLNSSLLVTFCITALTGYLSHLNGVPVLAQISQLIHLPIAFIYFIYLCIYIHQHNKKVLGVRRGWLLISGILLVCLLFLQAIFGFILLLDGVRADNIFLQKGHQLLAYLAVLIFVAHIILYKLNDKRSRQPTSRYQLTGAGYCQIAAVILTFLLMYLLHTSSARPYTIEPMVKNYQYDYGPHPFRPSQTETPAQRFIDIRALNTTEKCAFCHSDIAKQWQVSAHRQAASDKSYETNVTLLAEKKGITATRYCEGCHAPLALLPGQLSPGGEHAGISGTVANQQGVNCQSCHGIDRLVHNKGVASYHFSINEAYLFETSSGVLASGLNKLAIRYHPEQHKSDMSASLHKTSEYCAACHSQFIDKDVNGWGWIKMQDEYAAWLASPYSGMNDAKFSHSEQKRCQDCHMPLVESNDPAAKNGLIRDHSFLAANSMLTTLNNDHQSQTKIKKFMQSNKVRISIEPPHRKQATKSQLPLKAWLRQAAQQPFYWYRGEQAELNLVVANIGVGHNFPGGTIDINQAWVAIQVMDAEGHLVYQSGKVDKKGYLDKQAYQYRSLPIDRHGDIVWKHDLFNMVGKASVNVIPAGEADVVKYQFPVPYWAKSPLGINAQVNYRKFNTQYAKWALQDEYQPLPIITLSRAYLAVPIREKQEAY
ncbi:multiheme c-type cytochrome [Gayadomonas joobiniege]|uniref:multiheme c-type cytochrome n=1 Tax=Gayadomonas joobiniege TaxID=1234606 RepID=UPI00036FFBFB|nr:multiheme c-type cytochrome [Gayadomonas joobiniege]